MFLLLMHNAELKNISRELMSLVLNTSQGIIHFHKNRLETLSVWALFLRQLLVSVAVMI